MQSLIFNVLFILLLSEVQQQVFWCETYVRYVLGAATRAVGFKP